MRRSPAHLEGCWGDEDRALLRALGGRISQVIHGEELDLPDLQRRDELGIVANMVNRMARQLGAARRRDQRCHTELALCIEELQTAYRTQEKLLATLRELSSPILELHEGVALLPLAGALDAARIAQAIPALLEHIAARRPRVAIVHLGDAASLTHEGADLLRRTQRSVFHLGNLLLLSGVSPERAREFGMSGGSGATGLTPCATLQEALSTALDQIGYRITR